MVSRRRWDTHCDEERDIICPSCHSKITDEKTISRLSYKSRPEVDVVPEIRDGRCNICKTQISSLPIKKTPFNQHCHCLCGTCCSSKNSTRNHLVLSARGCEILYSSNPLRITNFEPTPQPPTTASPSVPQSNSHILRSQISYNKDNRRDENKTHFSIDSSSDDEITFAPVYINLFFILEMTD